MSNHHNAHCMTPTHIRGALTVLCVLGLLACAGGDPVPPGESGDGTSGNNTQAGGPAAVRSDQVGGHCPVNSEELVGTKKAGEPCHDAAECEPVCCSCAGASNTWLATACEKGVCSPSTACGATQVSTSGIDHCQTPTEHISTTTTGETGNDCGDDFFQGGICYERPDQAEIDACIAACPENNVPTGGDDGFTDGKEDKNDGKDSTDKDSVDKDGDGLADFLPDLPEWFPKNNGSGYTSLCAWRCRVGSPNS